MIIDPVNHGGVLFFVRNRKEDDQMTDQKHMGNN